MNRQTLALDFDGVIHSYEKGWQDGTIYGTVTPGFFDWAKEMSKHFTLVVYSSRSRTPAGRGHMKRWLKAQWRLVGGAGRMPDFEFAATKPPAWLTIDDRCICFEGHWEHMTKERLQSFRPWHDNRRQNDASARTDHHADRTD